MTEWVGVVVIAFVAQLAVLPGEKVQFIIAGLSTRFSPLIVVAAAGSAFAGWTVLEIMFGSYIQQLVPRLYLDIMTGLLFLLFAGMLVRSAPQSGTVAAETDGGLIETDSNELDVRLPILNWQVPNYLGGFLPVFSLMAFGEFGDKTQLVTIGLAAQYAHPTAIWVGEMAAIIPISVLNALFFFKFSHRFDLRKAHLGSALLFGFFGLDTLQSTLTGVSVWETIVSTVGTSLTTVVSLGWH